MICIKQELRVNGQIVAKEVKVVTEAGEQLGVMPISDALAKAEDNNLDLVEVAPGLNPVVCKIMDYGKYRYEQSRKEKEARKKQKIVDIKEVRLSATIDTHDFDFKAKNARKFLEDGDKVKATIKFKGRELNNTTFGANVLNKFTEVLSDIGTIDKPPKMEGRNMIVIITPKNS